MSLNPQLAWQDTHERTRDGRVRGVLRLAKPRKARRRRFCLSVMRVVAETNVQRLGDLEGSLESRPTRETTWRWLARNDPGDQSYLRPCISPPYNCRRSRTVGSGEGGR
jgi:hypothetical protein